MARKSKFTPEVQEKILRYLRLGSYVETAAAAAGIARDTFYDWMKRGAKGEKPYKAFAEAVDQVMAESEARDLAIILKAAEKNWTAAAWRLERRFPDRYGRHDRTKIDAKIDVEGKVEVAADEQLLGKLAGLIERARKARDPGEPQPR
jgi:transposase